MDELRIEFHSPLFHIFMRSSMRKHKDFPLCYYSDECNDVTGTYWKG